LDAVIPSKSKQALVAGYKIRTAGQAAAHYHDPFESIFIVLELRPIPSAIPIAEPLFALKQVNQLSPAGRWQPDEVPHPTTVIQIGSSSSS
jgi:hypothetical protein